MRWDVVFLGGETHAPGASDINFAEIYDGDDMMFSWEVDTQRRLFTLHVWELGRLTYQHQCELPNGWFVEARVRV
jgi:hypothetical protein